MKIALVVKKTRLETAGPAAKRLVEADDPATRGWRQAHEAHRDSLEKVLGVLEAMRADVNAVEDPYRAFSTGKADIVVVVGGDGTFLAASHSVQRGLPMLGVNSDPDSSRGFFCAATADDFEKRMRSAAEGRLDGTELVRMGVEVNGEVRSMRVLNEALLCHPHPAATTRFLVDFSDQSSGAEDWERHVSSGAWIGPPAGTTGAMRSAGGDILPLGAGLLQFVSRETISGRSRKVVSLNGITAVVKNDEAAVYMDGPYKHAALKLGDTVRFFQSGDTLEVLGLNGRR